MANDGARTAKYTPFLGSLESAVVHLGTNANADIGSVWYAGSQGGSQFTAQSSSSGLAVHVAAAKVRTRFRFRLSVGLSIDFFLV